MAQRIALFALFLCALLPAAEKYRQPPQAILDVLRAPAPPTPSLNPTRTHALLLERQNYPSIAQVSAPMLRLAGLRINPANNGPHTVTGAITAITIKPLDGGPEIKVAVPPGARLETPLWSPDGKQFAVTNSGPASVDLYLGGVSSPALRKIPGVRVNSTIEPDLVWIGSRELLVRLVPALRGRAPAPGVPAGPNVQETAGRATGVATLQDMLKSPHDEKLFDYYCTSQLATVDAASGKVTPLGKPAVFTELAPAPDGRHFLIGRVHAPYSYLHSFYSFPRETEIWDRAGKPVHKVHSAPLEDKVPPEGVPTGPRNVLWRPTEPATLLWLEALDGGDPKAKVPFRDRLMQLKAPFTGQPAQVVRLEHRAGGGYRSGGMQFGEKGGFAFISQNDRERRWVDTFMIWLDDPNRQPKTIWSRNQQDRYRNPGAPITRRLPSGHAVMHMDGDWIFLEGQGATPQGDRPFLNRMNVLTGQTETIFRAGGEGYEVPLALLKNDGSQFLTSFETPATPPNLFIRTRGSAARKALTAFQDPTPQLRRIKRELVKYKREDGVDLSFTLYLPPDYQPGTRLPAILWAYPLEYTDASTAGQVGGSTQRFMQLRGSSQLFLLLAGYAILNDATIPIIGTPEKVNDTYVEQLVLGAKAAIDKAAAMGVVDPNRIGVSGHSYGGFMTANLLAHTRLFKAGVARSGAHNRTLTPFGFQSERRNYWEARDTYLKMSPFNWANQIKDPVLFIHGEADNNSGTFPIQSERMYQAVRGNGGVARLVMLPNESHGYAARESIEHTLWEMTAWFDKYVKNAKPQ